MPTVRLILLLTVVVVSAYAVYSAGAKVKILDRQSLERKRFQKQLRPEDYSFMNRALKLAARGESETPARGVGTVVVLNGEVVGEGFNQVSTLKDPSAHAEMLAIRRACDVLSTPSLKGARIYVSESPCPMCLSLMYLSQVEKIYYYSSRQRDSINALETTHIQEAFTSPPNDRPIPEIPIFIDHTR